MRVRVPFAVLACAVVTVGLVVAACDGGSELNPQPLPPAAPQDKNGGSPEAPSAGDQATATPTAPDAGAGAGDAAADAHDASGD